jgi:hypothetical protein
MSLLTEILEKGSEMLASVDEDNSTSIIWWTEGSDKLQEKL